MNKLLLAYISAFVLLASGGMVYVAFRPSNLLLIVVLKALGAGDALDALKSSLQGLEVPDFVVYSLPAALWSAAYILAMEALWHGRGVSLGFRMVWVSLVPVMGVVSELMQAYGMLPGVFDWMDLMCYVLPFLVYTVYGFRCVQGE